MAQEAHSGGTACPGRDFYLQENNCVWMGQHWFFTGFYPDFDGENALMWRCNCNFIWALKLKRHMYPEAFCKYLRHLGYNLKIPPSKVALRQLKRGSDLRNNSANETNRKLKLLSCWQLTSLSTNKLFIKCCREGKLCGTYFISPVFSISYQMPCSFK